jgi:hypothetical protein
MCINVLHLSSAPISWKLLTRPLCRWDHWKNPKWVGVGPSIKHQSTFPSGCPIVGKVDGED